MPSIKALNLSAQQAKVQLPHQPGGKNAAAAARSSQQDSARAAPNTAPWKSWM